MLAEGERLAVGVVATNEFHLGNALGQLQRGLKAVGESTCDVVPLHQSVHHHFDRVLFVSSQLLLCAEELRDVDQLSVDSGANETLSGEVVEERVVLTLAAPYHRREHLKSGPFG